MGMTELYYRAFRAFRDHTQKDPESRKLRKTIEHSNPKEDVLTSIKFDCQIESDWIENIEEGLIYVEKAIREERQFIRTEGEVVPIEKVKRVSKASVEHLARHSNLITRVPEDSQNDLIPDELYIVEKLNDYSVYENRFLYMLLCYLKDFIEMRLVKIRDKTTTYQSHLTMNKRLDENQRHLEYRLNHSDIQKNDPYLLERYKEIPLVDRVENIYAITVSLLETPLMREVSKTPMIKPPVVKTNVLRMNQNFRAALKLYDFIVSYNKDGYTFKEIKKVLNPFPPEMGEEVAETIELLSNIAYVEGNNLRKTLEKELEARLKEQKEAEAKKLKKDLKRLRKRIDEMHDDPAEYILKLEKRNAQLEKLSVELASEKERNDTLEKRITTLEDDKSGLENSLEKLRSSLQDRNSEINALNQKYFDDMTEAEEIHQHEIHEMEQKHETIIVNLKEEHRSTVAALNEKHENKIQDLITSYETQQADLIKAHESEKERLIDEYEAKIASLKNNISQLDETIVNLKADMDQLISDHEKASEEYQQKIDTLKHQLRRLNDEKKTANARYLALKKEQGLLNGDEDYSSKVEFKQLETEMRAYKRLFKEQWKKAKRQIREDVKKDTFMNTDEIQEGSETSDSNPI